MIPTIRTFLLPPWMIIMVFLLVRLCFGFHSLAGKTSCHLSYSSSSSLHGNNNNNVNFEDWIADDLQEITEWKNLEDVSGTIPSFLRGGTLVRNGPGFWTGPDGKEQYSHLFDGIAKWSAYRFVKDDTENKSSNNKVHYKSQFVQSQFYKEIKRQGRLVPTIGVGPILSTASTDDDVSDSSISLWRIFQSVVNSVRIFDNAPVNVWDYNPTGGSATSSSRTLTGLTDAPARSVLTLDNLETKETFMRPPTPIEGIPPFGYLEFLSTAHPQYSLVTDDTYNLVLFLSVQQGPVLGLVKESNGGTKRSLVGKLVPVPDGSLPYSHSFGLSTNHAVVVLQPLRVDAMDIEKSLRVGFLRGMLPADETIILVFDLATGELVLNQAIPEKVYFYHTASTAEWKNDNNNNEQEVSIRLCAYKTPEIITGDDQFMRLERCRTGKEARNRLSKGGAFCDITCNVDQQTVKVDWKKMQGNQGFEFPMTRYSRAHGSPAEAAEFGDNKSEVPRNTRHPQFVYGIGHFAFGSDEYDSAALFKFEPETGQIAASYTRDSLYFSEPIVVANPEAKEGGKEDEDCVVLSQVYDGIRRETGLLVLDAKTMKPLAEAWTGRRASMDFHGVWIPSETRI